SAVRWSEDHPEQRTVKQAADDIDEYVAEAGLRAAAEADDRPLSTLSRNGRATTKEGSGAIRSLLLFVRGRAAYADAAFLFWRFLTRSSTTAGSAKVEVSPRLEGSSSAILRRMRRMIFPERVFGRPGANWIRSGVAIGPISLRTQVTSSLRNASVGSSPSFRVT